MQISRLSQLFLILGIFLIIFIALVTILKGQIKTQEKLKNDIALAKSILAKPIATATDLKAKIKAAETELQAAEALFPKLEQSLEITGDLFRLANQCQLKVTGLSTTVTKKKVDKIDYDILNLELKFEGQITNMLSFIVKLETLLPTAEIVLVSFDRAVEEKKLDVGKVGLYLYIKRKD